VQNREELSGLIAGIREVEEIFNENIVQARLNDAGNYIFLIPPSLPPHPPLPAPPLPQHVQNPKELSGLMAGIREVEEMFSENIVQTRLNDAGNYEVNLKPEIHLKGKEHELMTRREGGEKSHHQKQRSRRNMKNRHKDEANVNLLRLYLLLYLLSFTPIHILLLLLLPALPPSARVVLFFLHIYIYIIIQNLLSSTPPSYMQCAKVFFFFFLVPYA